MATLEELLDQKRQNEREAERLDNLIKQEQSKGPQVVAAYTAMREAINLLKAKAPELLPSALADMTGPQYPKYRQIAARRYQMSETEIHNAEERGRKSVAGL